MAKGIIYLMETVVKGLVKIGKTGSNNFETRMSTLERNGYANVVGLKRRYAIEVEDYDEKEALLHSIFSKSNVPNTELFALDPNLVIQLLASLEGRQVYPETATQDEEFAQATASREINMIPEGVYHMDRKVKDWGNKSVTAQMRVQDGKCYVLAGSTICPIEAESMTFQEIKSLRATATIVDNILQEEVECNSPSAAGAFSLGRVCNGWKTWKNSANKQIDIYRNNH